MADATSCATTWYPIPFMSCSLFLMWLLQGGAASLAPLSGQAAKLMERMVQQNLHCEMVMDFKVCRACACCRLGGWGLVRGMRSEQAATGFAAAAQCTAWPLKQPCLTLLLPAALLLSTGMTLRMLSSPTRAR